MQQNPQTKYQLQMVSQPFIYTVWLKCSKIPKQNTNSKWWASLSFTLYNWNAAKSPSTIPTPNGEPAFHLHCITEMQQNPQTKYQLQMVSQPFIYTV